MAKHSAAANAGSGQQPPEQPYVPPRATKVTRPELKALQNAAKDPNTEIWLVQLPAGVTLQNLSGVELPVPEPTNPSAPVTLAGAPFHLVEDSGSTSQAAGSKVVAVLPTSGVVLPVQRRLVLARAPPAPSDPDAAVQPTNAPAATTAAQPSSHKKRKHRESDSDSDDEHAVGAQQQTTGGKGSGGSAGQGVQGSGNPGTTGTQGAGGDVSHGTAKKDKHKDKSSKREKKEKKEKEKKKDKHKDKKKKKDKKDDSSDSD